MITRRVFSYLSEESRVHRSRSSTADTGFDVWLTAGCRDVAGPAVVQAITYVAHATNKDPDVRFAMERLAGDYLAATPTVATA